MEHTGIKKHLNKLHKIVFVTALSLFVVFPSAGFTAGNSGSGSKISGKTGRSAPSKKGNAPRNPGVKNPGNTSGSNNTGGSKNAPNNPSNNKPGNPGGGGSGDSGGGSGGGGDSGGGTGGGGTSGSGGGSGSRPRILKRTSSGISGTRISRGSSSGDFSVSRGRTASSLNSSISSAARSAADRAAALSAQAERAAAERAAAARARAELAAAERQGALSSLGTTTAQADSNDPAQSLRQKGKAGIDTIFELAADLNVQSAAYGIVLFGMGLVLLLESRREFVRKLTPALLLLAGFAFAKAIYVWLEMTRTAFNAPGVARLAPSSVVGVKGAIVLSTVIAGLFLAGYGLRLLAENKKYLYLIPVALVGAWITSVVLVRGSNVGGILDYADVLALYTICFPANLIAAVGTLKIGQLHSPTARVRLGVRSAALLFVINAFLAVLPNGGFSAAAVLNITEIANPLYVILSKITVLVAITLAMVRILRKLERVSRKDREKQQILEHESNVAAGIQSRLFPEEPLITPNVRVVAFQKSARAVGGDWYDYSENDAGVTFQVGDAAGKGVPAALLSSAALSTISVELQQDVPLPRVFTQANKQLLHRFGGGNFATLFLGRASSDGHTIRFINCGHEPPLLYRNNAKSWNQMETRHELPLGVTEGKAPRTQSLRLAEGDRMLVFSDGLHDVRDKNGNFLSMDEITEWLDKNADKDSNELARRLVEFAENFAGDDIPDDITVVVIERLQKSQGDDTQVIKDEISPDYKKAA